MNVFHIILTNQTDFAINRHKITCNIHKKIATSNEAAIDDRRYPV